jgi:hypothetical protein
MVIAAVVMELHGLKPKFDENIQSWTKVPSIS